MAAQMTLVGRSVSRLCLHSCWCVYDSKIHHRMSRSVCTASLQLLPSRLTAVPGLQLDFADAPLRFYGTSRAFGLVSDNGYVAFDYTTYPYDPNTFGTDDLGSPKVCTRKILAVVNVAGVQVQFTASPPRTLPDLFQLRADCPILQRCQPAGARCQLRHPGEPRVSAVGRDINGRRSSCCARPPGLLQ